MKNHKKLLFKKHDDFEVAEHDNLRLLLRMEIKEIIESVGEPDAQDFHILGLTYYDIDSKDDDPDIRYAHQYFIKALEKDNKYHISRLYSAHCYHDQNELENALENYLLVDRNFIEQEYALWRHVKLLEQIGYCLHKLGRKSEAREYFESVLGHYQSTEYDDLGHVDPYEVYQCLDSTDDIFRKLVGIEKAYHDRYK